MLAGFIVTICVVVGAAAGVATPVAATDALAGSLIAASLALLVRRRERAAPLVFAALSGAAAAEGALARERALHPPLGQWFDTVAAGAERTAGVIEIEGTIAADAAQVEGGVRLLITVGRVRDAHGWHRTAGRVQAQVAGAMAAPRAGDWSAGRAIRAPATLRRPPVFLNPGGASPYWQALRRPFDLTASVKSAALVEVERGTWWHETAAGVRRHVRRGVATHIAPRDPQAAAIVCAILIGDRVGLAEDVERRLQMAGTYHVIAISGGNVALLSALCFLTLRGLVRSPRVVATTTMLLILAYGWIVGGEPSVARAVAAACVYLAVSVAGLIPRAPNVLATVALLVVVADPLAVIDVGAWLSFGATLGIILCARRLAGPLGWLRGSRVVRTLVSIFAATIAAELVLLPISAAVFSRVSAAGLILNFVAIPAMAAVQLAGLVTVSLFGWWPSAAAAAALVAQRSADALVGSAHLVEVAPWLSWRVPPTPLVWTLIYYCALAVCLSAHVRRKLRAAAALAASLTLAIVLVAPNSGRASNAPHELRVTMLDVGQGDSFLVQFPSGHSLLVDTGGTVGPFDIGGRVITPAAWALGIRRLDWLAVTHGDQDHSGGALAVSSDLLPREIWEGVPVPPNRDLRALRIEAHARGSGWRTIRSGHLLELGDVAIEALHPPAPEWERQRVRNDDSLVLLVRYGDVEVLLTGDAGVEFERVAMGEREHAPIRVLKAGHHGSRTSSSEAFVSAYRPQLVLVSVGRGNLFGHPAPDVLARFARLGARVFRTDRDGAVIVETDGRTVRVRTWRGERWTMGVLRAPS